MNSNPISRSKALVAALLPAALVICSATAWAHHAISAKFDAKTPQDLSGVVTSVDWRNPHVHIFMNVKNRTETLNWAVELESPSLLEMDGWNKESIRPGDAITVKGIKARDGSRQVWGQSVRTAANGMELFVPKPKMSRTPLAPRPTPKWPDGHPALGSLPGMAEGYWTDPSETALVEDGVDVKMDEYGLLANLTDAAKVAPMQPWALGVYQRRQERQLRDDPTFVNCKPPGGVRQYQSRLGFQMLEDRARGRIFVLMGSGNRNYRIIYTDGRKQVGQAGGDDDNPLYFGRSSAKWEGNTLVVDTIGFNEDFWFTNGGLPHTSALHLTEKFTRTDNETMRYEVLVDDSGAYTRNWSASWTLKWNGGAALPAHFCQNNRQ
jgi:Family of unknown function (DUF6152)